MAEGPDGKIYGPPRTSNPTALSGTLSLFGTSRPKIVAFDIIETTFRIEPLDARLVALGLPPGSYRRLYAEGLRDAFALACANLFEPFMSVLKADLAGLLAEHGLDRSDRDITDALSIMRELPAHPDAKAAYRSLRDAGVRLFALSNGATSSTESLLERAGMSDLVEQVLSVEDVKLSKPRPEVYRRAVETGKVKAAELMLVACHPWDVAGARAAGLLGGYVARERPFPAGIMRKPEVEGASLSEVAQAILALKP